MRGIAGLGLVLLVVGACGDNDAPGGGVRSGSRLRATYLVHGDARAFQQFFDTERSEDCWFDRAGGSTTARCLPATGSLVGYADDDCTTPVMEVYEETCEPVPRYLVARGTEPCGSDVEHVWEVDLSTRIVQFYLQTDGGCVPATVQEGYRYHAAAREIPLDAFVRATIAISGDGRLQDRYLYAEDGAQQPINLYDRELDAVCAFYEVSGDAPICAPLGYDAGWAWSDDACSASLVEEYDWCDVDDRYAVFWRRDDAGRCWSRTVHELGPVIVPDEVYYGVASCSLDTASTTYRTLGDEVAGLAQATRALGGGDGRIAAYYHQNGAIQIPTGRLRDRDLGVDCVVQTTTDGERCLPIGGDDASWLWEDAACTTRAAATSVSASCEDEWPDLRYAKRYDYVDCTSTVSVHEVGAELSPGALYTTDDLGACVPYIWDTSLDRFYERLAEVPITTFAQFELITE